MKVYIELNENTLRALVVEYLERQLGNLPIELKDVRIEVKSKQNYRSEWESASFRAILEKG